MGAELLKDSVFYDGTLNEPLSFELTFNYLAGFKSTFVDLVRLLSQRF